nr:hypothetical protein B0A51_06698 [Rachicladosporium sp. CCFEE 5018]
MASSSCATCAQSYSSPLDPISEKPLFPGRDLLCCGRSICARCLNQNKRYETYCPYCQISTEPSALPQGLRDPPAYSPSSSDWTGPPPVDSAQGSDDDGKPPPYSANGVGFTGSEKAGGEVAEDVLHFVTPDDTMLSLSLAYGVPLIALRKANNVFADHLLQARRTILVPGEYYKGGVSLSPQPLEDEEELLRKSKVRRWMMACKVADIAPSLRYDVATLYLEQNEWELEAAVESYREDERWEKEHPLEAQQRAKKGKSAKVTGMRRFVGTT